MSYIDWMASAAVYTPWRSIAASPALLDSLTPAEPGRKFEIKTTGREHSKPRPKLTGD